MQSETGERAAKHTRGEHCRACGVSREVRVAAETAADEAWGAAWDAARDEDRQVGRQYDKRIYAEKARAARWTSLEAAGVAGHVRARAAIALATGGAR